MRLGLDCYTAGPQLHSGSRHAIYSTYVYTIRDSPSFHVALESGLSHSHAQANLIEYILTRLNLVWPARPNFPPFRGAKYADTGLYKPERLRHSSPKVTTWPKIVSRGQTLFSASAIA